MADIKSTISVLPKKPGVYLFKDTGGHILYVGKAKVLRSRVRSYFSGRDLDKAKKQMVQKIADVDTIACDTEIEALVLEANLIKQHQPPYNILLRDDKFYLFIKITTNEEWPRVFPVRKIKKDKARYFGPYSSAASVRQTLNLLRRIFPYRGETDAPREQIFPHPLFGESSAAREELGRSPRPSTSSGSRDDDRGNILNIIKFLQGKRQVVMETLKAGMKKAARGKNYEMATIFRDQLRAIERLEGYQKVYLPRRESFDLISVVRQENRSAANIFSIREGKLLNKNTFLLKHRGAAAPTDVLRQFILQYFQVAQDIPPVILVPDRLTDEVQIAQWINKKNPPEFLQPRRGKKRQLMIMGELNAQQLLNQESASRTDKAHAKQAAQELTRVIGRGQILRRIETYDISNTQGKMAVGSMVVFTDGQPDKRSYKKFKIQVGETPNDLAMLREVLTRRFSGRHVDWPAPDLILIDGGRGQLNVAQRIVKEFKIASAVAAMAKQEELLFVPEAQKPIRLPYDSPALFLIQRMRDESHRFGLAYHQLLRSQQARRSILDEIPGLGPKTKKRLLNSFGSVRNIKAANTDDLAKVIGKSKTDLLKDWL